MGAPNADTAGSASETGERSPFQGLNFYAEADAQWFFGRTTERKMILAHLRTARLTVLYAESGVGKSSLLRAGVAARLRELSDRDHDGRRSPRFIPVVFSAWRDDPVTDLVSAISSLLDASSPKTNGGTAMPAGPQPGLATVIKTAAEALDATLVIILDQFEEHFSYRLASRRPDALAEELAYCVNSPDVPANFLIAVREDAYGGLGDLFAGRIGNVYSNYLHLEYLTRAAAREAIERPVQLYNAQHDAHDMVRLDADLTEAVLDEVRRGNLGLGARHQARAHRTNGNGSHADEIETPFLQLVMTRLWDRERTHGSRVLRRATLDGELGGAETIVRNHVDLALAGLAGQELETAVDVFRDLVTPSGVKVAHTADDLAQMTAQPPDVVRSVLARLYEARIVRAVDPAPGTTAARYEIFHDRLTGPILDWRDQQENARLEHARQHAELEAQAQRAQARRFKRRARIMLGLAISLLILLIAVGLLWRYARDQSASASRAKRIALVDAARATYLGLTARAQSELQIRPDISLLLYLAAYRESPQRVAERSLLATLQAIRSSGAEGILHGHTDAVESIAFSPVGTTLASASGDKTIRLWSISNGRHYPLGRPLRANGPLFSLAFDSTGQVLASGGYNSIILWSIPRHAQQETIPYRGGAVTSIAFSRRGSVLAAAGSDGTVLLWNAVTHQRTLLRIARGPVTSVALSPDGAVLAAGYASNVALWSVGRARQSGPPLTGATGTVSSVAFSPDGVTVAAGITNGAVVRWDVSTRSERGSMATGLDGLTSIAFSPAGQAIIAGGNSATAVLPQAPPRPSELFGGHQGAVNSVAFSPDGRTFASASADRTITLWAYPLRPRFGQPLGTFSHGAAHVAISPDGLTIASGGNSGQIFLTNRHGAQRRPLFANAGAVRDLAFDPRGHDLAAAYSNGSVWFWDTAAGRPIGPPLRTQQGTLYSIAFDGAGTRLVSGGNDGTVRLWDVRTRTEIGRALTGGSGAVHAVAFSRDGTRIAAGGDGRAILLWDARSEQPIAPPVITQAADVFALAFSPNGLLLASGGADDTIRVWRIGSHAVVLVRTLTGHQNLVRSIAFSPDGDTLASGSTDKTVRLWDIATGTQLGAALSGPALSVESVAYSGDGLVAAGSQDGTVTLWQGIRLPSSFAQVRAEVCGFTGAGLSRSEWSEYAPNIPYQTTCPRTTPS